MTEKRFVETLSTGIVTDNVTGKEYLCEMRIDDELLELLNELDKENQDLATKKEDAEYELLHLKEKYEELLEENERLKEEKKVLHEDIDFLRVFIEKQGFKVKLDSDVEMIKCKDYGLNCLKCPYWNKWSQYCTRWKIWSE